MIKRPLIEKVWGLMQSALPQTGFLITYLEGSNMFSEIEYYNSLCHAERIHKQDLTMEPRLGIPSESMLKSHDEEQGGKYSLPQPFTRND